MAMILLLGCTTPEYMEEVELQEFINKESNGLTRSIETGKVTMKMSYRPIDFMVWQEIDNEIDSAKISQAFDNYDQYLYYVMQLSAGERDALYGSAVNQSDFSDKLQTLSFRMPQYINLTTSENDTIPLADAYYSRMFGMSASSDVLLVFNKEQIKSDEWISINTQEFGFKTGRRSFRFDLKDIKNTPKLIQLKPYHEIFEKN